VIRRTGRPGGWRGRGGTGPSTAPGFAFGGLLWEFNMTAMSRLYRRKFSNGDDDVVVAIFSPPGVRRVGLPYNRSAAGGH
jgi:hypothetical protein